MKSRIKIEGWRKFISDSTNKLEFDMQNWISFRLRVSRQEKLVVSSRILKALQDELVMEDNKFKEAVKAAEDNARRTEVCFPLMITHL